MLLVGLPVTPLCFLLQLRDHGDLPRTASVHVTVCSKMRAKLVSEVRENINKLKVCIFIERSVASHIPYSLLAFYEKSKMCVRVILTSQVGCEFSVLM